MFKSSIEAKRLELQCQLDRAKSRKERNRSGQFATPMTLAKDMLFYANKMLPENACISFLDPAIGTGAFYSALLQTVEHSRIVRAAGYEVDTLYGSESAELWKSETIEYNLADFTRVLPPTMNERKWNLVICNPPYIRHHYLVKAEKQRLQSLGLQATSIKSGEQAGLYGHFLFLAHAWMDEDRVAAWLIPGEFMDVNYGKKIREYLLTKVTLVRVHRFDPRNVQFEDALVSSCIIFLKRRRPKIARSSK